MVQYIRAKDEHRESIIDFINMVFSQAHEPHEFRTLLPKVYGEGQGHADIHVIALDEGKVRGCVAMYRFDIKIADEVLKVGYIGSVSAHIQDHGAGHMKALMKMQLDIAEREGLDMLSLGGQRQRYEHFGFEPCGTGYSYSINSSNIRHALKDVEINGISFVPFTEEDVSFAYDLFEKLPMHGTRTRENFLITLKSWTSAAYTILADGVKIGYIVSDGDHTDVSELLLNDYTLTSKVVKAWMNTFAVRGISVAAAPFMPDLNAELDRFAEHCSVGSNGCLRMINKAKVIRAYMKLKQELDGPFADGKTVLAIDGEKVAIECRNGNVSVENTDETADAELTAFEAVKLIFSVNRFGLPEIAKKLPATWFPLPMFLLGCDHF